MSDTQGKCPMPVYDGCMLPMFPILLPNADKQMTAIRDFQARESDILICNFAKTGTNWVYEILSMLVQGHSTYLKDLKTIGMLEIIDLTTLTDMTSPRVLNTHIPYRFLPKQHLVKGCKIVHVLRNPKDTLVSWYNHTKRDSRLKHDRTTEEEEFPGTWDNFLRDQIENIHNTYDGFFKFEKDWEAAKRSKAVTNVHTMFYEDLQKETVAEIKRLAEFLEVPADEELVKDIADKCSFQKLQKAAIAIKSGKVPVTEGGIKFLFRKGMVGDWKNWFTVAQNERFDELLDRELKGSALKFTYEI
ncbi:sulfotransferase 1C2-like [Mizuhopecten yessoensis]|uniref:Sulfotransferase 1C2 n=1 Tax=Mizuhopecten yessoensis TaxID=6573 RepID=A0A210R1T4_MIZYE|nr:sulfotransferase 1C2-like [Mizuhopecten yessoensis]XP_021378819.1 sulfotransferase 1C2-like [Mizuhopecten yessoensis]XP_021378829.1 sulfotransferase 1C2-like [Mizuhopecten yessoensis]XP_021378837.1 sulfotransferase 1C2-like [Mizuhopecten yessoensis]XP_021378845.1 sulfotransferase 1C2-like [Mizuhopecten yessoensis]OWF54906.1 Sulfotransferase 1C2 [Mizuhopecten yessoensis]